MVAVLVGFMGAGKTTVGHIVAERLGQPFVDSDVLIEQRLGRNIRDIFRTEGETYFRELEHATVAELVRGQEAVIALGGGAVEDPRTRAVLRNARVIYLRVGYDEAMLRVAGDTLALTPPLIVSDSELETILVALDRALAIADKTLLDDANPLEDSRPALTARP